MADEQYIAFKIGPDGKVVLEVINGDGVGCEGLLEQFSEALGEVTEKGHTADHDRRRRKVKTGREKVRA